MALVISIPDISETLNGKLLYIAEDVAQTNRVGQIGFLACETQTEPILLFCELIKMVSKRCRVSISVFSIALNVIVLPFSFN